MSTRTLLSLGCAAALAGAPAVRAEELASNTVELPLEEAVPAIAGGEDVAVSGSVILSAEVSAEGGAATLATGCEPRGGGTGASGARYAIVSARATRVVAVPAALPADAVLVCPANLLDTSTGAERSLRVRVRVTVHEDGHATFAVAGVEGA